MPKCSTFSQAQYEKINTSSASLFDIVAGTSSGAMNAAILLSPVLYTKIGRSEKFLLGNELESSIVQEMMGLFLSALFISNWISLTFLFYCSFWYIAFSLSLSL